MARLRATAYFIRNLRILQPKWASGHVVASDRSQFTIGQRQFCEA